MKAEDLMVYAITDRYWLNGAKLADQVEDVLKNGATFLQLREKSFTHEEMVAEAKEIKAIAAKYQVPFVINDDIYAAKEPENLEVSWLFLYFDDPSVIRS